MSSVAVSTTSFARSPRRLPRTRSRTPPELMTHTFAIFRRELRGYFATPLAFPRAYPALVDAALGGRAPQRHDRIVPDIADPPLGSGHRQVSRRLVFCGHRACSDLPVLDHRQRARRSR